MAELGIIAAVAQIADVGLRLSIKLYTFGEIVASADRCVISISKDVSLTSGVLKELGQILAKDRETRTLSENAVQTADGIVKECLEVFQEMETILVKKLPSLGGSGKEGGGERVKRATAMLERLKWGYLQPKLQLLRSNLDRLKSTLLLMLNVITYAGQVSEKTEPPSVIAEQRSLIQDLAYSNQEYIRKFERLNLGIEEPAVEHAENDLKNGGLESETSTRMKPLPPAPKHKFETMNFAISGTPLQEKENVWGLGSSKPATVTRSLPKVQAIPPNSDINNLFSKSYGQPDTVMPPLQGKGIPRTEVKLEFDPEVLFKQLKHYSTLVQNLLNEVDGAQYDITFKSRLRMKSGIEGLHEGERRELEKMWGSTALQKAEQRLDSIVEGLGELPRSLSMSRTSFYASPCKAEGIEAPLFSSGEPYAEDHEEWPSPFSPMDGEMVYSAAPHSADIGPSPTLVGAEEPRTNLLSHRSSFSRRHSFANSGLPVGRRDRPLPTITVDDPNDKVDVKRARNTVAARKSRAKSAAIPISQNASVRDSSLNSLPDEQYETVLRQGKSSAAPDRLAPQQHDAEMSQSNSSSEEAEGPQSLPSHRNLKNPDMPEKFDFPQYGAVGDLKFDPSTFKPADSIEIQSTTESEGTFAGLQGCNVVKGGMIEDKERNKVGKIVHGNDEEVVGQTGMEDGHVVNEHDNIIDDAALLEQLTKEFAESCSSNMPSTNPHGRSPRDVTYHIPLLRCSPPVSACQRCRSAKIRCDGKLPACTACEEAMQECTSWPEKPKRNPRRNDLASRQSTLAFKSLPHRNSSDTKIKHSAVLSGVIEDLHRPSVTELLPSSAYTPTVQPRTSITELLPPLAYTSTVQARNSDMGYIPSYSGFDSPTADSWEGENRLGDLRTADIDVVDRLVSLWTTVKL